MGRRLNVPEYACSAFPLMASGSGKSGSFIFSVRSAPGRVEGQIQSNQNDGIATQENRQAQCRLGDIEAGFHVKRHTKRCGELAQCF